jgi:hypothetical protein
VQVAAIALARLVAFIETIDLNPRGYMYFPEMVPALVNRYGFSKFPEKLEDFDETKGIVFEGGRFNNVTIHRIQVYNSVLVAETASSTTDSEKVLEDALRWGSETFGLVYRPGMIKRKAYVSQLTFYSDAILPKLHPALLRASEKLSLRVPQYFGFDLKYRPSAFAISHDPLEIRNGAAPFSIEARAEVPYSESKYFSTAPLPTEEHIKLLEMLEADLLAT